ncbi:MAG TPA: hypothetical protein VF761_13515 [Gemmatimonadaceae bacterium]
MFRAVAGDFRAIWRDGGSLARASLVLLAVAAAMHLAALAGLGMNDVGFAVTGVPHVAVIVLGWCLVGRGFIGHYRGWRARASFRAFRGPPAWRLWILFALIGLYMGAWALYLASLGEGGAEVRDGAYVWLDGARTVREITPAEYHHWNVAMLALFSAAWCWFSLVIAIGHWKTDAFHRSLETRRAGDAPAAG